MFSEKDIEKAKEIAEQQHADQKYGDKPYMFHVEQVVSLVKRKNGTNEEIILAYLHDVVEDTNFTIEQVKQVFGERMAKLVSILTDEDGDNRKERKRKTNIKLSKVSEEYYSALKVKMCDRLCNVKSSIFNNLQNKIKMYASENEEFLNAIKRKDFNDSEISELDFLLSQYKPKNMRIKI